MNWKYIVSGAALAWLTTALLNWPLSAFDVAVVAILSLIAFFGFLADSNSSKTSEKAHKIKQIWLCEDCKEVGAVTHSVHEDVMSVVYLIGDAHHEQSPNCTTPAAEIRVLNGAIRELPKWAQKAAIQLSAAAGGDDPI